MEQPRSFKNILQEHFQSRSLELPRYIQFRSSTNEWSSTCVLPDGSRFSAIASSKKKADQLAAKAALDELGIGWGDDNDNGDLPRAPEFRFPGCMLVLIDLENSPGYDVSRWSRYIWDCCWVEAFMGKLSSHAEKPMEQLRRHYPFVREFRIVNSGHADAVDHAISVRAGQWIESLEHPGYYYRSDEGCLYEDGICIISRDRFSLALIDILKQNLSERHPGSQANVRHFTNMNRCFEWLSEQAAAIQEG